MCKHMPRTSTMQQLMNLKDEQKKTKKGYAKSVNIRKLNDVHGKVHVAIMQK